MRVVDLALAALLSVGGPAHAPDPGFTVIVNASRPTTSLTKSQVSLFFLRKARRWENGTPVEPADLAEESPVRAAFSRAVHGRSTAAIKSYWEQQIFSGADAPPVELKTDADMVAYVRGHPNAIGYVSGGASTEGVKVVAVTGL